MAKYGNWFENAQNVLAKIANINTAGDTFTGEVTGDVTNVKTTYSTASNPLGDADLPTTLIELDGSTAGAAVSGWTPTVGKTYTIWCSDSTNDCAMNLSSNITWNGTNTTALFADDNDALVVTCVSATRLLIVENLGAVAFS